jgi:hypothetical protein
VDLAAVVDAAAGQDDTDTLCHKTPPGSVMMDIFLQGSVKIKEKFKHVKIVEICSASCMINSYLFLMSDVGDQ